MRDLREDIRDLAASIMQGRRSEGGRTVMFISARSSEGVSSVSASFGLVAAEIARKPVWVVDLDLRRNHQFNSFAVGSFAQRFGGVGPPYSATLRTQPFFSIEPDDAGVNAGLGLFTAHRVGDTRLMVTQFDSARLKPGHKLRLRTQPAYWAAVRVNTDWAVIDAPAVEHSGAGLVMAPMMDDILIVVQADTTSPAEVDRLRRQIETHGGRVAGIVLNRVRADALLIDRLTG